MAKINTNYLSTSRLTTSRGRASSRALRAPQVSQAPLVGNQVAGLNIQAPQIRSTIQASPGEVQRPLIRENDVTNLASAIQQKTLRIQEEENTLLARERLIKAKEELRQLGYGPENGYFLTQGRDSVLEREATEERAAQIVRGAFEGLDPAVQEKLVAPLIAERNAFSNQVARYATTQKKAWEGQVREANIQQFDRQLGSLVGDAQLAYKSTLHKAHELYPDLPGGIINPVNKEKRESFIEGSFVKQIEMLIDTPGGIEAASQRFDFMKEKTSLPAQQEGLKVLETGIRKHNKLIKEQETRYKQQRTEAQKAVQDRLIMDSLEGKPSISEHRLKELVEAKSVSPAFAVKYDREHFKNESAQEDKVSILEYEDRILEHPTGRTPDGKDILEEAMNDPDVPLSEMRRLRALQKSTENSQTKEYLKRGKDEIKIITAPEVWSKTILSKMTENNRFLANRELQEGLAAGKDFEAVMTGIRNKYNNTTLPEAYDGSVPTSVEEIRRLNQQMKDFVNQGAYSEGEAQVQYFILKKYLERIQNGSQD